MRKQFLINTLILLVAFSPVFYLLATWNSIPENFVTRFEFYEEHEEVQSRSILLVTTLVLSAISAALYLLMRNLKRVDPKVTEETPKSAFHKLGLAITIFFVIVNYFFIFSAKDQVLINASVLIGGFGLLMAVIGNYMNNLRPNYVAGIRLPWTLNDPENWRKTHHLAGKMWFAGGIVMTVCSVLLPANVLIPLVIAIMVILVVIPGVFSYRMYRSKKLAP